MSEAKGFAEIARVSFEKKANHNKNESLLCFILVLVSSLSAPLFITLGKTELISKVIPSVLSVVAAGLTSWLQLRKPQRLWGIYRNAQRRIELEQARYKFNIEDYKQSSDPESLLVERVSTITMATHSEWTEVIPAPEGVSRPSEIKSLH
jgi:hypothetical protein